MTKPNTRIVQQREDKQWEVVAPHADRASAITRTQAEANQRAKEILQNLPGAGERITKGVNGKINSKESFGNDPNPPRDKEHLSWKSKRERISRASGSSSQK